MDAERDLSDDLAGKIILLFMNRLADVTSTQATTEADGTPLLFRQADTVTETTEGIARLELDWSGMPDHAIQLNIEGAYNVLDGSLFQVEDTGAGLTSVDVPGGNSRVEESRGDFLLKDTWSLGRFELDYGLGAEVSTISQSGDAEQERSFFFMTPQATFSVVPEHGRQYRLRFAREIAQLDFNDFISSTLFEDDDLALGNPNLSPDKTWVAELSHERQFGDVSVVKLTAFHHWIKDVLDLLPLTPTFEVPGNIGDGRRWGMELESAVPLDWLGLAASRLDIKFRWQDSTVVDPVTGVDRVLGATPAFRGAVDIRFREGNRYVIDVGYRQDFEAARVAWGWRLAEQAVRPVFKVNEKELYNEGWLLNTFIETTRWSGVKARIEGHNLFNYEERRHRTLFAGERDLSPVTSTLLRERIVGRRVELTLTGSF
jgi:outer membrane receptor protein involved in Fe transport